MLARYTRLVVTYVITPIARRLVRMGVRPDAVTIVGTLGVSIGALVFYPLGYLFWGTVFITAFVFSDTLDGTMARMTGRGSRWGAFLDSTLDRVADAAVFGGLALYFAGRGDDQLMTALAVYCLAVGGLVPYVKARAEALGLHADVGIAERTDRLVIALVATGLYPVIPYLLAAALWFVALASTVTVFQRMAAVRRQAVLAASDDGDDRPPRHDPQVGA